MCLLVFPYRSPFRNVCNNQNSNHVDLVKQKESFGWPSIPLLVRCFFIFVHQYGWAFVCSLVSGWTVKSWARFPSGFLSLLIPRSPLPLELWGGEKERWNRNQKAEWFSRNHLSCLWWDINKCRPYQKCLLCWSLSLEASRFLHLRPGEQLASCDLSDGVNSYNIRLDDLGLNDVRAKIFLRFNCPHNFGFLAHSKKFHSGVWI